ncbi:hypothetical protein DH86_00000455 [Scytalidium sp. 3C]|nr:hypothetical protein DH86_00000455 [Scytalidium sp. 3C]
MLHKATPFPAHEQHRLPKGGNSEEQSHTTMWSTRRRTIQAEHKKDYWDNCFGKNWSLQLRIGWTKGVLSVRRRQARTRKSSMNSGSMLETGSERE